MGIFKRLLGALTPLWAMLEDGLTRGATRREPVPIRIRKDD